MRGSIARLAKQASEKYLTPGNPTGLTGLATSPAPRPILINVYNSTLAALAQLPAESAYRTSAEALTRHRLAILDAVKPAGHDAWLKRVEAAHPDVVAEAKKQGRVFAVDPVVVREFDDRYTSWNAEPEADAVEEGPVAPGQTASNMRALRRNQIAAEEAELPEEPVIELEPPLTADQISEIEQKIGAGLIEEVIEVAQGERKLVDVLAEHKVWEELEEKTPEGQWSYFERSARHTSGEP